MYVAHTKDFHIVKLDTDKRKLDILAYSWERKYPKLPMRIRKIDESKFFEWMATSFHDKIEGNAKREMFIRRFES